MEAELEMGRWTFNDPNPIVAYTVGVELAQPLTPSTVRHISTLHGHFRRELPRRLDQQAWTFQMGFPAPQPPVPAMSGVVFDSLFADGRTKQALIANQNLITFMTAEYSRWVEFWPLAERLLKTVGSPALEETSARAMLLTANNRFVWSSDDNSSEVDTSTLLRREQKYVAPYILDCRGQCHSFMGYMVSHQAPPGQRTDNVLLAVSTSEEGIFLDLNFSLRLQLATMVSGSELFKEVDRHSSLEVTLDKLHASNKELMRNILVDSVAKAIPGLCE